MAGFDIVQWCDFVRGVADPAIEEEMREYAATGTRPQRRDAELLRRLADYGRETEHEGVPREAVRIAHAIDSLGRPRLGRPRLGRPRLGRPRLGRPEPEEGEEPSLLRRLSFEVLFDSLSRPHLPQLAVTGTRSHGSQGRHLVLKVDKFTIDVRLVREPSPEHTVRPGGFGGSVVTGQILSRDGGVQPVPRAPVFIFAGDKIIRKILASPSGEFHAEGLPDHPLRLCLLVGRAQFIEVPLGARDLSSGAVSG